MKVSIHHMLLLFLAMSMASNSEELKLDAYPKSQEISYGSVVSEVRPHRFIKLKAPLSGDLYVKIASGVHEKGTLWAEFEPERIALERETMELTKSLFELKEKPAALLEIADSRAALDSRLTELKRNVAMMDEILREPELADLYLGREDGGEQSRSSVVQMKGLLNEQIVRLEDMLGFIGTPEQQRVELRLAELQLEKKESDLERKEEEASLKLPFSGEFRYLVPLPKESKVPLKIQTGDVVAELADYQDLEARMVMNRTGLRQLPPNALQLEFPSAHRLPIRATFESKETVELMGEPELIYQFAFPEEFATSARSLVGGRVSAELFLTLSSEAWIVPKFDLIQAFPDLYKEKGWFAATEVAFPGFRAVSVGQSEVAIVAIVAIPKADE